MRHELGVAPFLFGAEIVTKKGGSMKEIIKWTAFILVIIAVIWGVAFLEKDADSTDFDDEVYTISLITSHGYTKTWTNINNLSFNESTEDYTFDSNGKQIIIDSVETIIIEKE